jgi:hypothetical protein
LISLSAGSRSPTLLDPSLRHEKSSPSLPCGDEMACIRAQRLHLARFAGPSFEVRAPRSAGSLGRHERPALRRHCGAGP